MIAGHILIQTEVGTATSAVALVRDVPGCLHRREHGRADDVIVRARARSMNQPGRPVVKRIQEVAVVLRTTTCPVDSRSRHGRNVS